MKCFGYQGLRNDFKAAMEKIDQEYLAELIKQQVTILLQTIGVLNVRWPRDMTTSLCRTALQPVLK